MPDLPAATSTLAAADWFLLSATSAAAATSATAATVKSATSSAEAATVESAAVRKATMVSMERGVSAAKVPASEPVPAALAKVPGWKLAGAIALSEVPGWKLAGAVTYVARPDATGVAVAEIAASDIALAKTVLNLSSRRALTDVRWRALEPVCYVRVVIAKTAAKAGIVYPPVAIAYAGTVEIIAIDEVIIYKNIVISPSSTPTPVIPATTPNCTQGKSGSPS